MNYIINLGTKNGPVGWNGLSSLKKILMSLDVVFIQPLTLITASPVFLERNGKNLTRAKYFSTSNIESLLNFSIRCVPTADSN